MKSKNHSSLFALTFKGTLQDEALLLLNGLRKLELSYQRHFSIPFVSELSILRTLLPSILMQVSPQTQRIVAANQFMCRLVGIWCLGTVVSDLWYPLY